MRVATLAFALTLLFGCAAPQLGGTKGVKYGSEGNSQSGEKRVVSQAELQEDLQRFATQFNERTTQANRLLLRSESLEARNEARRLILRYASSVLEIATGPNPEVNLLDMITFVRLSREVLETYWRPKVYGVRADAMVQAFRDSEKDLIGIADKVSTKAQQERIFSVIDSWKKENPDQINVETVRLSDFSAMAGRLATERAQETGGLFSSVQGAVSSADQALLLGNRALFLGQRMPFLLRLQARIGTQEVLMDTIENLMRMSELTKSAEPLLEDMTTLTTDSVVLVNRLEELLTHFRKAFPLDPNSTIAEKLSITERITGNLLQAVDGLNSLAGGSRTQDFEVIRARIDELIWKVALALILVGAAWAAFGWSGYYLVRRAQLRASTRIERSKQDSGKNAA